MAIDQALNENLYISRRVRPSYIDVQAFKISVLKLDGKGLKKYGKDELAADPNRPLYAWQRLNHFTVTLVHLVQWLWRCSLPPPVQQLALRIDKSFRMPFILDALAWLTI